MLIARRRAARCAVVRVRCNGRRTQGNYLSRDEFSSKLKNTERRAFIDYFVIIIYTKVVSVPIQKRDCHL